MNECFKLFVCSRRCMFRLSYLLFNSSMRSAARHKSSLLVMLPSPYVRIIFLSWDIWRSPFMIDLMFWLDMSIDLRLFITEVNWRYDITVLYYANLPFSGSLSIGIQWVTIISEQTQLSSYWKKFKLKCRTEYLPYAVGVTTLHMYSPLNSGSDLLRWSIHPSLLTFSFFLRLKLHLHGVLMQLS